MSFLHIILSIKDSLQQQIHFNELRTNAVLVTRVHCMSEISNTLFNTFLSKFSFLYVHWKMSHIMPLLSGAFVMQLFLKILSGMANSIDHDQTAPSGAVWSWSTLFAYVILSETVLYQILGHLSHNKSPGHVPETIKSNYCQITCRIK